MAEMKEILVANLTLDTVRRNNIPPLIVPQGDYGARVIKAKITEQGKPVTVESASAVSIVAERSGDGEALAFSGKVNTDGSVTVPVTQWMLDVPEDDVICHVVVTGSGYQYSTTSFLIEPQKKANPTEITPDDPRKDVVTEVLAGEKDRVIEEAKRRASENTRKSAEEARVRAEEQRLTDEATRVANEAERVSSELSRDATFKGWANDIASLPSFDSRISANSDRLTNIEAGLPSSVWRVDDTAARVKDVPENARPKAIVSKIGGMSYKTENLIPFPYADANKTVAGVTYTDNGDGSIAANGTPTAAAAFKLFQMDVRDLPSVITISLTGTFTNLQFRFLLYDEKGDVITTISTSSSNGAVIDFSNYQTASYVVGYIYRVENGVLTSGSCYPMLNEGSTAKPYSPYFTGLRSAKVTAIKSVGVNLFDGEVLKGYYSAGNGSYVYDEKQYCTKNFIPVLPITQYFVSKTSNYVLFYDSNKNFLSSWYYTASVQFATPERAAYMLVNFGNAETNNIMINAGATALPYTPYVEHTLPIPEAVQALDGWGQGIPGTDCYNFVDWRPEDEMTEWRKCTEKLVIDGSETIYMSGKQFAIQLQKNYKGNYFSNIPIVCSHYDFISWENEPWNQNNSISYFSKDGNISNASNLMRITDNNFSTVDAFKEYLAKQYENGNPLTIVYALSTPEVTDISDLLPADNLISVEGGGTLTFENEHGYDMPNTVTYMLKEVTS